MTDHSNLPADEMTARATPQPPSIEGLLARCHEVTGGSLFIESVPAGDEPAAGVWIAYSPGDGYVSGATFEAALLAVLAEVEKAGESA